MPEPSSTNVIQWTCRARTAEYVGVDGAYRLEPIRIYDASAVFEAEAAGKLRFISEHTRKYWQSKRRSECQAA